MKVVFLFVCLFEFVEPTKEKLNVVSTVDRRKLWKWNESKM